MEKNTKTRSGLSKEAKQNKMILVLLILFFAVAKTYWIKEGR